jgi:hypothetical protein
VTQPVEPGEGIELPGIDVHVVVPKLGCSKLQLEALTDGGEGLEMATVVLLGDFPGRRASLLAASVAAA